MSNDTVDPYLKRAEQSARRRAGSANPPMTLWIRLPAAYVPQFIQQARDRAILVDDYALMLLVAGLTEAARGAD